MKYCVKSTQSADILRQADEISVRFSDYDYAINLSEKYPDKRIIIEFDGVAFDAASPDYENVKNLVILCPNAVLRLTSLKDLEFANDNGIPAFWKYPVETFYEAKKLLSLGVKYIIPGHAMFFDIINLKTLAAKYGAEVRAVPNRAFEGNFKNYEADCPSGTWILPQQVAAYEPYVDVLEFITETTTEERGYFRYYLAKDKWLGDMSVFFKDMALGKEVRAEYLDIENLTRHRLSCRRKCDLDACHNCYNNFTFAATAAKKVKEILT